jgi:Tfp pilus assembly protein PilN
METRDLDELQRKYKEAADRLVAAIRAEEALANADHSETAWEKWDEADFTVQDTLKKAKEAREHYKDGLRALHFDM